MFFMFYASTCCAMKNVHFASFGEFSDTFSGIFLPQFYFIIFIILDHPHERFMTASSNANKNKQLSIFYPFSIFSGLLVFVVKYSKHSKRSKYSWSLLFFALNGWNGRMLNSISGTEHYRWWLWGLLTVLRSIQSFLCILCLFILLCFYVSIKSTKG